MNTFLFCPSISSYILVVRERGGPAGSQGLEGRSLMSPSEAVQKATAELQRSHVLFEGREVILLAHGLKGFRVLKEWCKSGSKVARCQEKGIIFVHTFTLCKILYMVVSKQVSTVKTFWCHDIRLKLYTWVMGMSFTFNQFWKKIT